jgi:acyl carrier protein
MRDGKHVERTVFALIAPIVPGTVDVSTMKRDVSLRWDLDLDSLGLWGLILRFAERLGVEPEDLVEAMGGEPVQTVADLLSLGLRINGGAREGVLS